jgi:hypothetical protein
MDDNLRCGTIWFGNVRFIREGMVVRDGAGLRGNEIEGNTDLELKKVLSVPLKKKLGYTKQQPRLCHYVLSTERNHRGQRQECVCSDQHLCAAPRWNDPSRSHLRRGDVPLAPRGRSIRQRE